MKIKPLFIYLGAFVLVVIAIIIFSTNKKTNFRSTQFENEKQIPDDDIHNSLGTAPGGGNVSSEFRERMNKLKAKYEEDPGDTANTLEYGRLLAAAHKPEEALKIFNYILVIDKNRDDVRFDVATVYYNLQRFSDAKRELEMIYRNGSNSPDILYNLGAVEATLGNNQKAKELWQKVIENHPESEAAEIAGNSLKSLK